MKIKELIEILKRLDPEALIVLHENNGEHYSLLETIDENAIYEEINIWNGLVYSKDWNKDDMNMTEKEWELTKEKLPNCIVLCPTDK